MPHRLAAATEPVARAATQEYTMALAAICEAACRQSAMAGALVARGMHPMVADQVVRYWESTGMTISPEVTGQIHPTIVRPEITREAEQAAAAAMMAYRPELAARPDMAWRPDLYRPTGISPVATPFPTVSPISGISPLAQNIWGPMSTQMPSWLGMTDPFAIQ